MSGTIKDRYISTAALANRWGVSASTLRNWRQNGEGPAYMKAGSARNSSIRYLLSDVIDYERRNRKGGS